MFAVDAMKVCDYGRRGWPADSVNVELPSAHCEVWESLVKSTHWKVCASVCENTGTAWCGQSCEDSLTLAMDQGAFRGNRTPAIAMFGW